jgi:hypothetical protein
MIKSKNKNSTKTKPKINNVNQNTDQVIEADEVRDIIETKEDGKEQEVLQLDDKTTEVIVEVGEVNQEQITQSEQAPQAVEEAKQEDEVDKSSKILEEAVLEQSKKLTAASINIDEVLTTNTDDEDFLKKLSKEIKKRNEELYAQVVNVGRGTEYIFIKPKNNVYCYARFVEKQRHQDSSTKWEIEFLANIPPNIHSDILSIAHACGSNDSRRVFFNPSGML